MLSSKDYYVDLINSSKAYKFTSYYHYSGVGFKKAKRRAKQINGKTITWRDVEKSVDEMN